MRICSGYNISIKVQNNLGWSSRIYAKFINSWWPDVFSTNVFASSFKVAAACARMIFFPQNSMLADSLKILD